MTTHKPIKITLGNAEAIESWLREINGSAEKHTYTVYAQVESCARYSERQLGDDLHLPIRLRVGASALHVSGAEVPKNYGHSRIGTSLRLVRRPTGWFLTSAGRVELDYRGGRHLDELQITAAQAEEACRRMFDARQITVETTP